MRVETFSRYRERVLVAVSVINGTLLTGTVTTATLFAEEHGVAQGDVIQFAAANVCEVHTL